jgi:hypothetical protein
MEATSNFGDADCAYDSGALHTSRPTGTAIAATAANARARFLYRGPSQQDCFEPLFHLASSLKIIRSEPGKR